MNRREFSVMAAGLFAAGAAVAPAARGFARSESVFTFVVLGTDKRTPADPELTDIIMVSRVDVAAGTVRTLSIPRDLYVEIPGHGHGKINAAFNYAVKADPQQRWEVGAAATLATITHNFGLQFDGVALTDMQVFPRLVDAVGGVTVDNPYHLTDRLWAGIAFPAGPLDLDGERALIYCRMRSQDGDGGRVMRQHLVLRAILDKLQDPAMVVRLPELVSSLNGVVRTTIPAEVQAQLLTMLPTIGNEDLAFSNIDHLLWPDSTASGAWIYQGDWSTLPGYVQAWLDGTAE